MPAQGVLILTFNKQGEPRLSLTFLFSQTRFLSFSLHAPLLHTHTLVCDLCVDAQTANWQGENQGRAWIPESDHQTSRRALAVFIVFADTPMPTRSLCCGNNWSCVQRARRPDTYRLRAYMQTLKLIKQHTLKEQRNRDAGARGPDGLTFFSFRPSPLQQFYWQNNMRLVNNFSN